MRGLGITPKQRRYAYNVMNTETTKKEAVLASGYTESMARNPAKIENSNGFKLAMAGIFAQSGNVSMAILNEMDAKINAGELKKQDMKSLVNYFDVMTRAMERIAPKDSNPTLDDVSRIFAGVVGQEIPSDDVDKPVDNLGNESDSKSSNDLTNVTEQRDLTSIVSDAVVHSDDKDIDMQGSQV